MEYGESAADVLWPQGQGKGRRGFFRVIPMARSGCVRPIFSGGPGGRMERIGKLIRWTLVTLLFLVVVLPLLVIFVRSFFEEDKTVLIGMSAGLTVLLLLVGVPVGVVHLKRRVQKAMTGRLVCTTCGHYGEPVPLVKGDMGTEIVLWLLFVLPGLMYSLWRQASRYDGCAKCGGASLVPVDSPVGRKLLVDAGAPVVPPRPA